MADWSVKDEQKLKGMGCTNDQRKRLMMAARVGLGPLKELGIQPDKDTAPDYSRSRSPVRGRALAIGPPPDIVDNTAALAVPLTAAGGRAMGSRVSFAPAFGKRSAANTDMQDLDTFLAGGRKMAVATAKARAAAASAKAQQPAGPGGATSASGPSEMGQSASAVSAAPAPVAVAPAPAPTPTQEERPPAPRARTFEESIDEERKKRDEDLKKQQEDDRRREERRRLRQEEKRKRKEQKARQRAEAEKQASEDEEETASEDRDEQREREERQRLQGRPDEISKAAFRNESMRAHWSASVKGRVSNDYKGFSDADLDRRFGLAMQQSSKEKLMTEEEALAMIRKGKKR